MMTLQQSARLLGRYGGRARAQRLAPEQRKKIASLGGIAKALSYHAARRIEDNFRYLEAIEALRKYSKNRGR